MTRGAFASRHHPPSSSWHHSQTCQCRTRRRAGDHLHQRRVYHLRRISHLLLRRISPGPESNFSPGSEAGRKVEAGPELLFPPNQLQVCSSLLHTWWFHWEPLVSCFLALFSISLCASSNITKIISTLVKWVVLVLDRPPLQPFCLRCHSSLALALLQPLLQLDPARPELCIVD